MNLRGLAGVLIAFALTTTVGVWGWSSTQNEFVHSVHERVFPSCDGCHKIEPTGVTMPEPSLCESCHNGQLVREVDWEGYDPPPSNLDFDHSDVLAAKEEALGFRMPCKSCHVPEGAERMDVQRAVSASCLGCHASGSEHYAGASCDYCHVPLTEAKDYSVAELAGFPMPADHASEDFAIGHGALAMENVERCSVCHARDLCSSCHVNAPSVPAIQALSPDPRVAELVAGREVEYPLPASHTDPDWLSKHGGQAAEDVSNCSTCHARNSCQACHVPPGPDAVQRLPRAAGTAMQQETAQERGPGVRIERRPPPSHVFTFAENHRALAASATARCEACHTENQCVSCHTASEALARPGRDVASFHPDNYMQQHSADAFSQAAECATCHNTEAYCRDCHSDLGLTTQGRIDSGFHNKDGRWVFGHGQAARQALESCAACHGQRDCLVCHSARGGRRINPHGPGFDADKLRSKNSELCLFCHFRSFIEP